jgi:hypothetical protein
MARSINGACTEDRSVRFGVKIAIAVTALVVTLIPAKAQSPMPAGIYDFWRGEISLINPTKLPLDSELSVLAERFANSDKEAQAKMRTAINVDKAKTLLMFSKRSAVFAIREKNVKWIGNGLNAIAMIEAERVSFLDILRPVGLLHYSARRIGANADRLVSDAAKLADPNVAKLLTSYLYLPREEKTIQRFSGYDEVETVGGIGFIGWNREKYQPTYDLKKIALDLADIVNKDQYQVSAVEVAAELPPSWLEAPDNTSLKSVLKRVRAGAAIRGEFKATPEPMLYSQTVRVFLVETEDKRAAQELLAMAQRKRPTTYGMLAFAEDRLFCLLIGNSVRHGVPPIETSEKLERFSSALTEILKRYSKKS